MKGKSLAEQVSRVSRSGAPLAPNVLLAVDKKRLTIRLDPAMHRALRILSLDLGRSVDAIVVGLIAAELATRGRR